MRNIEHDTRNVIGEMRNIERDTRNAIREILKAIREILKAIREILNAIREILNAIRETRYAKCEILNAICEMRWAKCDTRMSPRGLHSFAVLNRIETSSSDRIFYVCVFLYMLNRALSVLRLANKKSNVLIRRIN